MLPSQMIKLEMYYFLFSMRLVAMPGGYHENYLSTTLVSFKSVLTDQNCLPSGFMCEFVIPNVLRSSVLLK